MTNSDKAYYKTLITYITAIVMFGLDQYTKQMVISSMPISVDVVHNTVLQGHESYKFLSWLWFTHVVNFGAAFSTFYGRKYMLMAFAIIISLALVFYERVSYTKRTKVLSFSMGFLLAGATGNLFDRMRMGYVTDFLDLRSNGQNIWPIFNVADISINIGIALLVIYFIFQEANMAKENNDLEDEEIVNR